MIPLRELAKQKVSMKAAFRIRSAIAALQPHLEIIESSRLELIAELSDGGDDVPEDKLNVFHQRMTDFLQATTIEFDARLSIEDLDEHVQISANHLDILRFLFVDLQDEIDEEE